MVSQRLLALEVFVQGKFMTLRELLAYFELTLVFTVRHDCFVCRVAALSDSQSQALNSNLLRDKL